MTSPPRKRMLRSNSKRVLNSSKQEKKGKDHLRPHRPVIMKPTIPKPFKLHETKKTIQNVASYKSVAETVREFHRGTPQRFHTKSKKNTGPSPIKDKTKRKRTIPQSPHFESTDRKRVKVAASTAELEAKEVEEAKRYQFRARPFNPKVFTTPLPVKPSKRELTKPVGFDFTSNDLIDQVKHKENDDGKVYEFHAKPVPEKILKGVVGVKPKKEIAATVPESPAFALKNRVRSFVTEKPVMEALEEHHVKANPVPYNGVVFQPKIEHRFIKTQPFSFAERDEQKLKEKEEKVKQIIEEETKVPEFQAQLLPDLSHPSVPEKKPKPVTKPSPFKFEGDERGKAKAEQWVKQVEEDLREQKMMKQFKAAPCTVINEKPFVPKKPQRCVTTDDIELHTEKRLRERQVYDSFKQQRENEKEALRLEREQKKKEQEEEEIAEMRQAVVHKAATVRQYKKVAIKPSTKKLTKPESPNFSDKRRAKMHDTA